MEKRLAAHVVKVGVLGIQQVDAQTVSAGPRQRRQRHGQVDAPTRQNHGLEHAGEPLPFGLLVGHTDCRIW